MILCYFKIKLKKLLFKYSVAEGGWFMLTEWFKGGLRRPQQCLKSSRDFSTVTCGSLDALSCLFSYDAGPETFPANRMRGFELEQDSMQM